MGLVALARTSNSRSSSSSASGEQPNNIPIVGTYITSFLCRQGIGFGGSAKSGMYAQIKARAAEVQVGESVRSEKCSGVVFAIPLSLRYHLIQLIRTSILGFITLGLSSFQLSGRCPPAGPSFGAARRTSVIRDPDECQPLPDPLLGGAERVC